MSRPTLFKACLDDLIWVDFENISAVFNRYSGSTHFIIPDQRHILNCAAKEATSKKDLLDRLIEEFDCEADSGNDVRETLSKRLDELAELGLLKVVLEG